MYVVSDGERTQLKTHRMHFIRPGEILGKVSGGGAGVGDPRDRDPAAVLADVIGGYVSAGAARDVYGVAIDEATMTIDAAATAALRGKEA
jgi:N-methylhydantoinase B/oxoprolinase/acetone carboxylase alpha subunit